VSSETITKKQHSYESATKLRRHCEKHGKQSEIGPLKDSDKADFCDICYPREETSEVFEEFITWAKREELSVEKHTGQTTNLYIQAYRAVQRKAHPVEIGSIVKKVLCSVQFGVS
jgi:hypothetical protein